MSHVLKVSSSDSTSATPSMSLAAPKRPISSFLPTRLVRIFVKPTITHNTELEAQVTAHLSSFASIPTEDALVNAGSSPAGLGDVDVIRLRIMHGENELSSSKSYSPWRLLFTCSANPFNYLLLVLAAISIGTGDRATFSVMMFMVLVSTALRFWQERKSIHKAAALSARLTNEVLVQRFSSKAPISLSHASLVPGDIVVLSSGDLVPADCVLLTSHALTVSQSALTGEVMPVDKSAEADQDNKEKDQEDYEEGGAVIQMKNVLIAGSSISTGDCTALVVTTGDRTYVASIAKMMEGRRPINAFESSIRKVSYLLLGFMSVMTPLVFVIQGTVNKSAGWTNAFLFAIAVAVGLTPEMLPVVVNANLAQGAIAMGKQDVIVKRLDGVQNLGGITCLCSDKTGTLTIDRVELHSSVSPDGLPSTLPIDLAFLNSSLQTGTRSLLDAAITKERDTACIEAALKFGEVPFDSSRRLLSIYAAQDAEVEDAYIITKGAVEEVLERCTFYINPTSSVDTLSPIETLPLNKAALKSFLATADKLNTDGLRLVAVAQRRVPEYRTATYYEFDRTEERDLVFVGFLAFLDPPKEDAADAIRELASLGIPVKILTGDAPAIAVKVARDIGLLTTSSLADVITGAQLTSLSSGDRAELITAVTRAVIFAKLSPYQKLEVVQALREGGHTVGMMGDGVNDALALRGADVGISVDTGTEIAKNAADIILLEKSLATVVVGVKLGRKTLLNTVKYIKMAASSNFGNVFSILAASAWLPYQPILPLQILIQNLLYDFSQSAIPWDNVDADYLVKPVKWSIPSVARFMIIFGPVSSIFDIITFCINWFYYGITTADHPNVALAQTNWFIVGATTQTLVIYFLRTGKIPFYQSSPSRVFFAFTIFFLSIDWILPYIPGLNSAFGFVHLDPLMYAFVAGIVFGYCTLVQLVKIVYQRVWREWL